MVACLITSMAQEVIVLRRLADDLVHVFSQQIPCLYQVLGRLSDLLQVVCLSRCSARQWNAGGHRSPGALRGSLGKGSSRRSGCRQTPRQRPGSGPRRRCQDGADSSRCGSPGARFGRAGESHRLHCRPGQRPAPDAGRASQPLAAHAWRCQPVARSQGAQSVARVLAS